MNRRMNTPTAFGMKIRIAMLERGMTVKELADQLGCHYSMISKIVTGTGKSERIERLICDYLDIDETVRNIA